LTQVQEAHAQSVQDCHSLSIEHERELLQLRALVDEERAKSSNAEAASAHWQQRYSATNSMLLEEQQSQQQEIQAARVELQRLSNDRWRAEASETQLKLDLASALQRCEELSQAAESERSHAAQVSAELNSAHSTEMAQVKKALAEAQGARVDAGRDLDAAQEQLRQLRHDHEFEKGILMAAIEKLQSNVELLQKQLQV
jgi:hypothetical protein